VAFFIDTSATTILELSNMSGRHLLWILMEAKMHPNKFIVQILTMGVIGLAFVAHADIETSQVEQMTITKSIKLDARVEAINQTTLAAQTSGQIAEILFDAGDAVSAGSILIKLRDENQQATYGAAVAELNASRAALKDAGSALSRIEDIYKRKLASQQTLDSARAQFKIANANNDASIAHLNKQKEQLKYTVISAPYSGVVLERLVNLGEIVAPGTPLFIGTSLDQLRVVAQIPQKDIEIIKHHSQVTIELPGYSPDKQNLSFTQKQQGLKFYAYASDKSATFKVRVALPEQITGLYPGMYLKSYFKTGQRKILAVPDSSIVKRSELRAIYVLDKKNRLHLRQLRLGEHIETGYTEVISGLSIGEKVVTNPQSAIRALTQVAN